MEWVETTGRTVDEALDAALDQLGVDEQDAEFEVIEEPKVGLFGRVRGEARIRARVRPTRPRPKDDRRDRRRRAGGETKSDRDAAAVATTHADAPAEDDGSAGHAAADEGDADGEPLDTRGDTRDKSRPNGRARERGRGPRGEDDVSETGVDVPMEEQGAVAVAFLEGLLREFGTEAEVSASVLDDESFEVAITGNDLGLFIGPKGSMMSALQDLTRTVVQRKTSARTGRLLLDVAGYRQKRKEALERFARSAAEKVVVTGARVVLEPMNPADRKIVHDTVNGIAGVVTTSQGEDPRRRVVLMPENPPA